jgi:hypothetical protein
MILVHLGEMNSYLPLLRGDPRELKRLQSDLTREPVLAGRS